jgi:hypothetical protein
MRRFTFFLVAVATMAGLVTLIAPAPGQADGQPPHPSLPKSLMGTATGGGFPRPMKQATSTV